MKPAGFATLADFRAWLEAHHADRDELLVGFHKKGSGRPSITWPESVDEALTVLECDPPRRLVVSWAAQDDWTVELDLWTEGGRTVLRFRQVFAGDADVADFAAGWHWYLDKLDAEVGGRPVPPDWVAFAADVAAPVYGMSTDS